jgi:hypothetical protein
VTTKLHQRHQLIKAASNIEPSQVRMAKHGQLSPIWTKFEKSRKSAFQLHLKYIEQLSAGF